jgi:hypothetical protein
MFGEACPYLLLYKHFCVGLRVLCSPMGREYLGAGWFTGSRHYKDICYFVQFVA